jgi:protein-tyrosine phosphatase
MKKHISILTIVLLSSFLALSSCNKAPSKSDTFPFNENYVEDDLPSPTGIVVSESEIEQGEYDFHTPLQAAYLASSYDKISSFAKGNKELNKPYPISFKAPSDATTCRVYETNNKKYHADVTFRDEDDAQYVDVINLKADTNYTVEFNDANKTKTTFKTDNCLPRNVYIDGVKNVRDIGGYTSKLGGKIRQGLYYRGGRFNYSDEKTTIDEPSTFKNELTDDGYETAVNTLRLKSEVDLRMNESHFRTTYAHEYGMMDNNSYPDIEYVPFPLDWKYSNMMKDEKVTIGNIFKFLANEDNYPVYVHCNIGTDRTGMITYLLGSLLGIPQIDLYYDYLFSNFANINGSRDLTKITSLYQKTLLEYQNINIYYDTRDYLKDCGVSDEEMNKILRIFIETI